jgi:hypothetical protein
MNVKAAQDHLKDALKKLFGELPFKVIFARDHDCLLEVVTPCALFETVDLGGKVLDLKPGFQFSTCILGLHKKNASGSDMLPILWGGKKVWVSQRHLREIEIKWGENRSKKIEFGEKKK